MKEINFDKMPLNRYPPVENLDQKTQLLEDLMAPCGGNYNELKKRSQKEVERLVCNGASIEDLSKKYPSNHKDEWVKELQYLQKIDRMSEQDRVEFIEDQWHFFVKWCLYHEGSSAWLSETPSVLDKIVEILPLKPFNDVFITFLNKQDLLTPQMYCKLLLASSRMNRKKSESFFQEILSYNLPFSAMKSDDLFALGSELICHNKSTLLQALCREAPTFLHCRNANSGDTLLHVAVKKGDIQALKFMIGQGRDPNLLTRTNRDGDTPLSLAKDLECYELLVDYTPSVWSKNQGNSLDQYLDAKHVGQILGDSFGKAMKDSKERIEGAEMGGMIQFLNLLLTSAVKKTDDVNSLLEQDEIEQIREMLKNFELCQHYSQSIEEARNFPHKIKQQKLRNMAERMSHRIQYLKEWESVILPGGWLNKEGGHAMLFEITHCQEGEYCLRVLNSGRGMDRHQGIYSPNKLYLDPAMTFTNLTVDQLSSASWIESLLELQLFPQEEQESLYDDSDVYGAILKQFEGHEIKETFVEDFITPQRMGSCVAGCWMACLRKNLSIELYKKITFLMHKELMESLKLKIEKEQKISPLLYQVIKIGTKHFSHLVWKLLKERVQSKRGRPKAAIISPEEGEKGINSAISLRKIIEEYSPPSNTEHPSLSLSNLKPLQTNLVAADMAKVAEEIKTEASTSFNLQFTSPSFTPKEAAGLDITQYLYELHEASKNLCSDKKSEVALQVIKETLWKIPLITDSDPAPPWNTINDEQIEELIQVLGEIGGVFFNTLISSKPHPEMVIVLCKIQALVYGLSISMKDHVILADYAQRNLLLSFLEDDKQNVTYSVEAEEELAKLLAFFRSTEKHNDGNKKPAFFGYSNWKGIDDQAYCSPSKNIVLPIPHNEGEYLYLSRTYDEMNEKEWGDVDNIYRQLSSDNKERISVKDWRIAHLWTGRFQKKFDPFFILRDLSVMGMLLLYNDNQVETPLKFNFLEEKEGYRRNDKCVKIRIVGKNKYDPYLSLPSHPTSFDKTHQRLDRDHHQRRALGGFKTQNDVIVDNGQDESKLYDITQEKVLSTYHLKLWLESGVDCLLNDENRTFCQLVLFRGSVLLEALKETPDLGKQLLRALDRNLSEIDLMIKERCHGAKGEDQKKVNKLLEVELFLYQTKFRLFDHIRASKTLEIDIQKEVEKTRQTLSRKISGNIEHSIWNSENLLYEAYITLAGSYRSFSPKDHPDAIKMLLWIFHIQNGHGEKYAIDPSIYESAQGLTFRHAFFLQKMLKKHSQEMLSEILLQVHGVSIPKETTWEGAFPHFTCPSDSYTFDFTLCSIKKDGIPLTGIADIYQNDAYLEVYGNTRFPLTSMALLDNNGVKYEVTDSEGNRINFYAESTELRIEKEVDGKVFRALNKGQFPQNKGWFSFGKRPFADHYTAWVSVGKEPGIVRIEEKRTGVLMGSVDHQGIIYYPHSASPHSIIDVNNWDGGRCFLRFDHPDMVIATQDDTKAVRVDMLRYRTGKDEVVQFGSNSGDQRLRWNEDPNYFLSKTQAINGIPKMEKFLIMENDKGEQKALIPLQAFFTMKNAEVHSAPYTFPCEVFDLSENGSIEPKTTKQRLFAAYLYHMHGMHLKAVLELKKAGELKRYTADELRILGWIFFSLDEREDYIPEALSVRSYASWLALDNLIRFPKEKSIENVDTEHPKLYENPTKWEGYWEGNTLYKTVYKDAASAYAEYLNIRKNVHARGRLESSKSGKGLLRGYEEIRWLHQLQKEAFNEQLAQRLSYLTNGVWSTKYVPNLIHPKVLEDPKNPSLDLPIYRPSFLRVQDFFPRVRPKGADLKLIFYDLIDIAKDENHSEREDLIGLLHSMRFSPDKNVRSMRALLLMVVKKREHKKILKLIDVIKKEGTGYVPSQEVKELKALISLFWREENSTYNINRVGLPQQVPYPSVSKDLPKESELTLEIDPSVRADYIKSCGIEAGSFKKVKSHHQHNSISGYSPKGYFEATRYDALLQDYQLGCDKNDSKDVYLFSPETGFSSWKDALFKLQVIESTQIALLHEQVIELAHTSSSQSLKVNASLLSEKMARVQISDMLIPFIRKSKEEYRKVNPFLTDDEIETLHNTLGTLIVKSLDLYHIQAKVSVLEKLIKQIDKSEPWHLQEKTHQELGPLLEQAPSYDLDTLPEVMVFEWIMKTYVRPDQRVGITQMVGNEDRTTSEDRNLILQKMMAGGKTFVWGTIMTALKADGKHLSILVPPDSLFEINAHDMKMRSEKIYGQLTHALLFERGSHQFNVEFLTNVYNTFTQAIVSRDSVILPPYTLQCLQNQYIEGREQLAQRYAELSPSKKSSSETNSEIENLESCTEILKKILLLIKNSAVLTFDEVDVTLSVRKENNFPIGESFSIPKTRTKLISELFLIAATDPDIQAAGLDLFRNRQAEMDEKSYEKVKKLLAQKIIIKIKESLFWQENMSLRHSSMESQCSLLFDYIINPSFEPPKYIEEDFASGCKERIEAAELTVLLKMEINEWLSHCFKKSAFQSHGFSKKEPQKEYAIPYTANGKPSEGSDFSDPWEMVNRTLQLYLCSGLNADQTSRLLIQLQANCRLEWLQNDGAGDVHSLPIAKRFFDATGLVLMELNPMSKQAVNAASKALKRQQKGAAEFVLEYACDFAIPQYKMFDAQINNNAQNLASMAMVTQGYTGTVENKETFPDDIHTVVDAGTNGQIIDMLLGKSQSHAIDATEPKAVFRSLIGWPKVAHEQAKDVRAFIDLGPLFKGMDSQHVAKEILDFFITHPDQSLQAIKGVLYFDDTTQMLSCLKKGKEESPILLPLSDPDSIYSSTRLKPEELFAYYPHHKITGADLKLPENARAFASVSERTPLRDLLQGVMRMRGLFANQHVDLIISKKIVPLIAQAVGQEDLTHPSIADLILFAESHEAEIQKVDLLRSTLQKITHQGRHYAMQKLFSITSDGELENSTYMEHRHLFVRSQKVNLYDRFAFPSKEVPTVSYLFEQANQVLLPLIGMDLRKVISPNGELFEEAHSLTENQVALCKNIHSIILKALDRLPNRISNRVNLSWGRETTVEQVAEQEKKVTAEELDECVLELQAYNISGLRKNAAKETSWSKKSYDSGKGIFPVISSYPLCESDHPAVWKLTDVITNNKEYSIFAKCFPDNINISENFLRTIENKRNLFDTFQKTPYEVLASYNTQQGSWTLTLLSIQEAAFFKKTLPKESKEEQLVWLLGMNGELICQGKTALKTLPSEVKKSLDQSILSTLIISKRIRTLASPKWRLQVIDWLKTEPKLKRDFFENVIISDSHADQQVYRGSALEALFLKGYVDQDGLRPSKLGLSLMAAGSNNLQTALSILEEELSNISTETPTLIKKALHIAITITKLSSDKSTSNKAQKILLSLIKLATQHILISDDTMIDELMPVTQFPYLPIQKAITAAVKTLIEKKAVDEALKLAKGQVHIYEFGYGYNEKKDPKFFDQIQRNRYLTLKSIAFFSQKNNISHASELSADLAKKIDIKEWESIFNLLIKTAEKQLSTPLHGVRLLLEVIMGSQKYQIKNSIGKLNLNDIVAKIDKTFYQSSEKIPELAVLGDDIYLELLKFQHRRLTQRGGACYALPALESLKKTGSPYAIKAACNYGEMLVKTREKENTDSIKEFLASCLPEE